MEPTRKPPDHKFHIDPIDSGDLPASRHRDGTQRTSIDRLSDVVDRLYGPDYRAARRLIHKRLRQKEMGSRGRKQAPTPPDETLYHRIMQFRNGKGETPGSSPHSSAGSDTPHASSSGPNSRNRTPQRTQSDRTPQRTQPQRAQQRTPPPPARNPQRSTPQSNRTPQKTPPAKRPVSRPLSRNAKKYEVQNSPPPSKPPKPKYEASSPYDRGTSKSSFDSVELPPFEDDDDDDDHIPTPKPTQQERIQSTRTEHRHYRKIPDSDKPDEPTTARDVYVEMGDEARDTPSRMSRKSARQDELPPVREATPKRADRPLSRAHSDLNRHQVVPPIKSNEENRESRNTTPDQRDSRPSSNVSNRQDRQTPDQRQSVSRRSDEDRLNSSQSDRRNNRDDRKPNSAASDKSNSREDPSDRTSRQPSRASSKFNDRDNPNDDQSNRAQSKPNTPENKQTTNDSRRNTPTSDDARATVLSPRDHGDSPVRAPPEQKPSTSREDEPVREEEANNAYKGNPNNRDSDQSNDANDDSENNEDEDDDSPPESPEPDIPRRTPKVREEDGRIAALDKLADYNLKTLAGQEAGEAPEIDDDIMKEVFSPEFQKELDNFLKT